MSPTLVLIVALTPGPSHEAITVNRSAHAPMPPGAEARVVETLASTELQLAYQSAVVRSIRQGTVAVAELVPDLVELHARVERSAELSSLEKRRMQRTLRGRLEQLRGRLQRDIRRQSGSRSAELAGGAATAQGMQQLIDLIQSTIEPDSWNPAGNAAFGGGNAFLGGNAFPAGGGGGANAAALELADLIRNATTPESWDINGGPGTITVFGK